MSVCIVHRDGWAVSDSRSSYGGHGGRICPAIARKIFKVQDHALVAAVGSAFLGQMADIQCNDKSREDIIGELGCYMMQSDGDGCLLMVDEDGYLAEICGEGSVESIDVEMNFWAIGCAADLCIGYLMALESQGVELEPEHAEDAIKMAAKFNSGIDDRTQVVFLGNDKE